MTLNLDKVKECIKGSIPGATSKFVGSLPDDKLYLEMMQLLSDAFIDLATGMHKKTLQPIAKPLHNVMLIYSIDGQISNGGFNQYLFNRANQAALALNAILEVCGPTDAAPLKSVLDSFKLRQDIHIQARNAQSVEELLQNFSDSYDYIDFADEDRQWYRRKKERRQLVAAYMRNNIEHFTDDSEVDHSAPPSPLDLYWDDRTISEITSKCFRDYSDKDTAGSRIRYIQCLLNNSNELTSKGDYVAACYLMFELISSVERWELEATPVFRQAMEAFVPTLQKLNRVKQSKALAELLLVSN